MKLIADSRGRLTSAEIFTPGSTFDVSRSEEGAIVLRKMVPEIIPTRYIQLRKSKDGRLQPKEPLTDIGTAIEDAVRAERNSRA
jgi:hypothetical protein